MNEDEQLAAAIAASLQESRVELNDSNEDLDGSDLSQPDSDLHSTASCARDRSNHDTSTCNAVSRTSTQPSTNSPKKTLKKIFAKPRKRKLSDSNEDNRNEKFFKMPTSDLVEDENNAFVLAPEYFVSEKSSNENTHSLKLSDMGTSSSKIQLLLKHPDGHREEVTLPACSKIKVRPTVYISRH